MIEIEALADVYDAASQCNKCSLCQAVCPTYVVNPVEWETARGRVSLIRDAIEGKIELRSLADGPLSTCLTCDNCVAACAPGVPTAAIVTRARQELQNQEGHPWRQTFWLRNVLPRPGTMRLLNKMARVAYKTGLPRMARRTGLTQWLGITGAVAERVTPAKETAYQLAKSVPQPALPLRGRLGFLMCCYQNVAAPEATAATLRVLSANGFEVIVPTLGCSGLPARNMGDGDAELEMAAGNASRLADVDVDAFVGDVSSCTAQWKRYDAILEGDHVNSATGRRVANRTWLASDLLAREGQRAKLGPLHWKVAIDEPCTLPLDAEVRGASRSLLSGIPRLEIVELNEAAMCCGGPGMYYATQRERSDAILERKFQNVIASGADVLVTENISCITQLREGAARYAPKVRVMHVFEVLDAAIERGRVLAAR